jgi:hypothetical protein
VKSDLERLSNEYELAESAFMEAVRTEAGRDRLAAAARTAPTTPTRVSVETTSDKSRGVVDCIKSEKVRRNDVR